MPPNANGGTEAPPELASRRILGMRVDATSYGDATDRVLRWAASESSRYVCVATVNNVMESYDDQSFRQAMNAADLITPDGMPLVWSLKMLGVRGATRVYGPDLTPLVLKAAADAGIPVGFYGGTDDVLDDLEAWTAEHTPGVRIAYRESPPFRPATEDERAHTVAAINDSGARIVFVGLGCPKQERWMAEQRGSVQAVMLGVGAAFDFLTGRKRQAPRWMQRTGLEWLFRLVTEPGRLWRRYLKHNPRFVLLVGRQVIAHRLGIHPRHDRRSET
jgi:N-acetylglucosaminyldiphosphoundecaprenol N-acetyl-beta-D-mannosaminyltransferase